MYRYLQRISLCIVVAVAFSNAALAQSPAIRIAVVADDAVPAIDAVIEALHKRLPDAAIARMPSSQVPTYNANLMIALGPTNANAASALRYPLIAAVPDAYACSRLDLKYPSACITTTPPARFPLTLIKMLYPTAPKALLFVRAHEEKRADEYRDEAARIGVSLQVASYQNTKDIFGVLALTAPRTMIIALPDPTLFNRDSLKAILEVSYPSSIGVIGYSRAFADAGALAAVYIEPQETVVAIVDAVANAINRQIPKRNASPTAAILFNSTVTQSLNIIEVTPEEFSQKVNALNEQ